MAKITKIKLGDTTYDIDVAEKDITPSLGSTNVVTSDGIAQSLNLKLPQKPDGNNDLINEDGKLNTKYLSDSVLGQVKFGGTWSSGIVIQASALLRDAVIQKAFEDYENPDVGPSEHMEFNLDPTTTQLEVLVNTTNVSFDLEGFYFITSADSTFAGIDFKVGDWLIASGGKWAKVDNTDAVTSVNGQIGAVNIDTGVTTLNNMKGDITMVAGNNIVINTNVPDKTITISATAEPQVQADWNENNTSSAAYINNRTHYEGESTEVEHTESICYGGPPMSLSHTFRDGETYNVSHFYPGWQGETIQFTVGPDAKKGSNYCFVGNFALGNQGEFGMADVYLYGDGNGEYNQLISFEPEDAAPGMEYGGFNFYTVGLKQLDAKFIPVDNDTIKVENGKLVGATKLDLSNVNQDVNIVGDHSLNISGDLNIDGALGFGYLKGTTIEVDYLKVTAEPEEDTDVVNKAYFDSHSSNVDLSNYTGDVNIDGNVAITGDLSSDGDIEFASLSAQSIKVNGKRVLVEGDTTGSNLSIDSFDSTYFTTNTAGKITLNMNALLTQEW